MKIVLFNPPSFHGVSYVRDAYCAGVSKGKYNWPPLDLMMVSGTLAKVHEVVVLDADAQNLSFRKTLAHLTLQKPDYVVSMTSSASRGVDIPFFEEIKKYLPECRIVILGDIAATIPQATLESAQVIDGAISNFLDPSLSEGFTDEGLTPVRNLGCREGESVTPGNRVSISQPRIPTPRHDLFPLPVYKTPWAKKRWITTTTTSDGCPYRCNFCTVGLFQYESRPVEDVVIEFQQMQHAKANEIYFQDFLFTADHSRIFDLCSQMVKRKFNFSWCCLSRVNNFDRPLLQSMKKAGCHTIQLGLESGSDEVLARMKKGFTVADIKSAVALCRKENVRADGIFMIGYPEETQEDIADTIALARELPLHFASFVIVTPSPQVPMVNDLKSKGIQINTDISYDDSENVLPLTDITAEELVSLRKRAESAYYLRFTQIIHLLFGVRSLTEIRFLIYAGFGFLGERLSSFFRIKTGNVPER